MPKTKPKHRTLSQYEKGFEDGKRVALRECMDQARMEGFEMHTVCMLYALKDKFKAPDADIMTLHQGILFYVDMIRKGFIEFKNMKKSLYDVFGYTFSWTKEDDT